MNRNKSLEKRVGIWVLGISSFIASVSIYDAVIANSLAYVTKNNTARYQELQAIAEQAALDESTIHESNASNTLRTLNASEDREDAALEAAAPIEAPEFPEPSYDGYPQSLPESLGSDYDDVLPSM